MSKTKKPAQSELVTGLDACICIHAALRKCCHSPASNALYHLIQIIDVKPEKFDPWRLYGILVAERLAHPNPVFKKDPRSKLAEDALQTAAGRLEDELVHRTKDCPEDAPDSGNPALQAIIALFQLLTAEDWAGMAAFL